MVRALSLLWPPPKQFFRRARLSRRGRGLAQFQQRLGHVRLQLVRAPQLRDRGASLASIHQDHSQLVSRRSKSGRQSRLFAKFAFRLLVVSGTKLPPPKRKTHAAQIGPQKKRGAKVLFRRDLVS